MAEITIGGTATHVWNEAAASHTMSLSVEPVGLPVGADVTYNTGDYSSSDTDVAIVTAGGSPAGTTINVTAKKGGQAVITAKATYGGNSWAAAGFPRTRATRLCSSPVPRTAQRSAQALWED